MNRDEFTVLAATTLDEIVQLAEEKCGKRLSRNLAFRWLGSSYSVVSSDIPEYITERIFIDEEHIYPCVDIGVGDVLDDGTLLIVGIVAGYKPRPFGKNWTGRSGPFVPIVGAPFLNKISGKQSSWSPGEPLAYIIPDVAR
jgi:hypothetical protein